MAFRTGPLRVLLIAAIAGMSPAAQSPEPPASELFKTIAALDAAVFDAYNRCDVEAFASYFDEDLEFYHDQTGLTRTRQLIVEALKKNICGKVRRELDPASLRIFPLRGFGAVQTGVHRFCENKLEKCGPGSGEARFVHLWRQENGRWRITRVISYDHCSKCSPREETRR